MKVPVRLGLYKGGRLFDEVSARELADLNCRIEMLTGIAWLDVREMYAQMLALDVNSIEGTFKVCHSYEKWGDMQQEVENIKVWMERV
ncbi:MAG: hypothetical protein CO186_08245 [Zetaproteobacteria bacterium CG_4_9_14_3_um_filter_49_83]|nr:MAG: hypothetical protein AUJ56_08460 [Zetaproteobacteria bacterium CG1_02_49_23]PIQ34045.1 MAG: hypothetical protein COW62_03095 [Zetaproteobacteria bacterium CG17_big_fil_post_rev_8_21_14_2_50_50_13]PIY55907.1 MAG: hypothetical protein COZ00_07245 [Zetaproteobacteria bacterium CG_4_10_14_0_8_um_filter_49_80]PJA35037.1 MAG: hypothetical protein CO186_08245 [Zetaproteobacteria bacterium CG_4_9_14_3_um_filter_49_83]